MTAPQIRLARLALLALLAAGIGVLIWALFVRPGELKKEIATEKAGATVATGRAAAAEDATKIVERYHDRTTEIRTIQTAGVADVAAASDDIGAGLAARRAICLLDNERQLSDPACGVFEAGAGVGAKAGDGLAAAIY